eukprot:TRINITY_DN17015_c0_g1_i1.p1 TRINITY_DN17015_c0_g1~~TRINITY_DN17015_c0_g1_i1.p1  ORF type:complete len:385 (-),score=54.49 TRINITY_DN17015_c0_g1_i1:33-1106(-)
MLSFAFFAAPLVLATGLIPPVPFSESNTDGLPTKDDWDVFSALYEQVQNDSEMTSQRGTLLKYAADQVAVSLPAIKANLNGLGVKGFDMVWPGDGFNGVAYGGLFETLKQLEKVGVSQAGKRMGASGGAASTILTMGDSDLFLKLYQVYELFYKGRPDRVAAEGIRDTGVTAAIYAEAVRDDNVFAQAQRDALILSKCRFKNTIFRGFQTRTQLVSAGYSSGDASAGGFTIGTSIGGSGVDHCSDGGAVTVFPSDAASPNFAVLLYNTPWVSTAFPTADSIDTLFRAGVDNAIATLQSPTLSASVAGGSMAAATPGPHGIVTATEFAKIANVVDGTQDISLASAADPKSMTVEAVSV